MPRLDQLLERDPRRLGRLRQQARLGEARDRLCLEHLQVSPSAEDHVDPREAVAAEQLVGRRRQAPAPARRRPRAGRRGTRSRSCRSRSEPRSRRSTPASASPRRSAAPARRVVVLQQPTRQLAPLDVPLEQHAVVVAERGHQRLRARRRPSRRTRSRARSPVRPASRPAGTRDAPRSPAGRPAAPSSLNAISLKAKKSGVGSPSSIEHVLRQHLVHAAHAREHAGAGVRHADDLEQLLDGAVLAAAPVQRDERHVGLRLAQLARRACASDVDRHDLVRRAARARPRPGAADRSETWRSSDGPPLRTATRRAFMSPGASLAARRGR